MGPFSAAAHRLEGNALSVSMPSSPRPWVYGILALVALVGLGLAGVQLLHPHAPAQRLELYYSDPQAMFLIPVEEPADPAAASPAAWAESVVGRLRQAPDASLVPVLTPDIKILEASYHAPQWNLKLEVGPGFGSAMERLAVGSLVKSFVASYPGADRVEVRLMNPDGKPYEGQHLDLSRPLTGADFVNRLDGGAPSNLDAVVWWRVAGGSHLVPVQVPMAGKSGSLTQDAFERLVAGPPASSQAFLGGVVPSGLKVRWEGVEDTVARVSLEGELPQGPEAERFVAATVLTLTEQKPIDAVQFLKAGKPLQATVGRFTLGAPVHRPEQANLPTLPANAARS